MRLSVIEYPDLGIPESCSHFLEVNVSHLLEKDDFHAFREKELWTKEVNNLIIANIDGLQTTLKKYSESNDSKYFGLLSFEDLESIFMLDSKPRIL